MRDILIYITMIKKNGIHQAIHTLSAEGKNKIAHSSKEFFILIVIS